MTRRRYHLQKDVQYMNIKKNMLVSRIILRRTVCFFIITSGQILCCVLVMLLLYGYNVAIFHVKGIWILHGIQDNT